MGDLVTFPRREPAQPRPMKRTPAEPLWREMLGQEVREHRLRQQQRLVDVATRAGISTQYLSEIERGRKEPSSEMVAAVAGALGLRVVDLTAGAVRRLGAARVRPGAPVALVA